MTNATSSIRVLALGGSTTPLAASERALRICAQATADAGADVTYLTGRDLMLPTYDTESDHRTPEVRRLVDALRSADGLIVASPGYHGAVSGMIKNALDYAEDLRRDDRPYLDSRAVGVIAVAHGWQTAVGTLNQLRQIVHALRGWPTPLGCAINDSDRLIGNDVDTSDAAVVKQLQTMGHQVYEFALAQRALRNG